MAQRSTVIVQSIKSTAYVLLGLLAVFALSIISPLEAVTAQSPPNDWPSYQWDTEHTGNNSNETVLQPPLAQLWSQTFDTSGTASMIDVGSTLYIKYNSGALVAADDQTGNVLWQAQTNYGASVSYANGIIYAVSFDSGSGGLWRVNGYDALSGTLTMQTTTLPGNIVTLTVANNVIYAGTADTLTTGVWYHTLTAFDATSGNVIWQKPTDDAVISYPIVENGIIYFGTYQGSMYAINASNGSTIWQHHGIYAKSSPILQNGILYEGSGNEGPGGPLFALNASNGSTIWTNYGLTQGYYVSPAYASGIVYAQSSSHIGAFNGTTGQLLWSQPIGFAGGNVTVANGVLYAESNSPNSPIAMYALDPTSGQILWQFTGSSSFRSPLIANHTFYFGSDSGQVYALHNVNAAGPTIQPITISPAGPVLTGSTVTASAQFTYPNYGDTVQGTWQWGDGSQSPATITPSGVGSVSDTHTYAASGVYTVTLSLTDTSNGVTSNTSYQYVTVYDNGSSFAGGKSFMSPTGAIPTNPSVTGKATFGINVKYSSSNAVTGSVKFDFKIADMSFASTSLSFLVTTGGKGIVAGTGTLNGNAGYSFLASGIDGSKKTNTTDLIRFQIKDSAGTVVYDSQPGTAGLADPATPVDTGNVRVN